MRATDPEDSDPQAAAKLARALRRVAEGLGVPDLEAYASACQLSAPERRVLAGLLQGHAAVALASLLGLAPSTVRRHIAALRRKTGHGSVAELMMSVGRLPPVVWPASEGK